MSTLRVRERLSLKEAVVLADVPERDVRKDINTGWLPVCREPSIRGSNSLWLRWNSVFVLAAVYTNELICTDLRKRSVSRLYSALDGKDFGSVFLSDNVRGWSEWNCHIVNVDRYLTIDFRKVFEDVAPRVSIYAEGLRKVEERDDVLGGEPVFENSRLPVRHIGEMVGKGESVDSILEDYPYLTERDIKFAYLYFLSHPPVGRPRNEAGVSDDDFRVVP